MKKKLKVKKYSKKRTSARSKIALIVSVLVIFFGVSIYYSLTFGSGPLAFMAHPNDINNVGNCSYKGGGPIDCDPPAATPKKTPVSTPVKTPSSTPLKTPVSTPVKTPSGTPVKTPASTPKTDSSSCMQKCISQGTPASTCATVNCYVAPPASTPNKTPASTPKTDSSSCMQKCISQGTPASTCATVNCYVAPPPQTPKSTPGQTPGGTPVSTPATYNNNGGKTCPGGSAGVNIPDGKWAASGKNMGDGKESERECVQCQNGVWKGSAACHTQYQKDPTNVILPPQAGNEYTQGVSTKKSGGDTNYDLTYKENCYDSSGVISPTGTGKGADRCYDGKWVKEADFDAKMKDTCGTKVYNATTNKCEDAAVKPTATPTPTGTVIHCGKYYRWDGKFCVADIANPDRFDEAVTAAKAACVKDTTKQYDMGTGLCILKTQPLSPVRQFECIPGQHGTTYITCEPAANGAGASASYHFCSAKGANGVPQEYVQDVGCRDVGTPVNTSGYYTGGESTKNASECKYGAKSTTNSSGARTTVGFTCLFADKTSTPPASSSPISTTNPGNSNSDLSHSLDGVGQPIIVCKNESDCVKSCGGRYVSTTEVKNGARNTTSKDDQYYCGDKSDIDAYLKKMASENGVTYTGTTEIVPPKPTNIENAGDSCAYTIPAGNPNKAHRCSEYCPDYNGDGFGDATSIGGNAYKCNSAPKVPEGKPAPKSLAAGQDCSKGSDDSCDSGLCRKGTNPADGKSSWYCMTTSNTNTKDITIDGQYKQKNGAYCLGKNDMCASGFCQVNTGLFTFRDRCADNPFVAPSTTSNKNAAEQHVENLQVKYEEIIKKDPKAFQYIETSWESCEKSYPGECIPVPGKTGRAVRDQGIIDEARRLNISLPERDISLLNNNSVTPTITPTPTPTPTPNLGGGGKPLFAPLPVDKPLIVQMQNADGWANEEIKAGACDNGAKITMRRVGCGPTTANNIVKNTIGTNDTPIKTAKGFNDDLIKCTGTGTDAVAATLEQDYGFDSYDFQTGTASYADIRNKPLSSIKQYTDDGAKLIIAASFIVPVQGTIAHIAYIDKCTTKGAQTSCKVVDSAFSNGHVMDCLVDDESKRMNCSDSDHSDPEHVAADYVINFDAETSPLVDPNVAIAYPPGV